MLSNLSNAARCLLFLTFSFLGNITKRPMEQEIRLFLRSDHQNVLFVINLSLHYKRHSSLFRIFVFIRTFKWVLFLLGMHNSVKINVLYKRAFHIVSWNSFWEKSLFGVDQHQCSEESKVSSGDADMKLKVICFLVFPKKQIQTFKWYEFNYEKSTKSNFLKMNSSTIQ